jgi:lysophospholipase L1-like esterase
MKFRNTVSLLSVAFVMFGIAAMPHSARASNNHYLIDFGSSSFTTDTTGWNNFTEVGNQQQSLVLVDTTGATTTVELSLPDPFMQCGPSAAGTTVSSLYSANSTRDSFFIGDIVSTPGCVDHSATVLLEGLDQAYKYEFRIYASRVAGDAANRIGIYTIGSASTTLDATDNINSFVTLSNVVPNDSGEVSLSVTQDPSAVFAYLGVLEITGTLNNTAPVADAGDDVSITAPDDSIILEGSGMDGQDDDLEYSWTKTYGGMVTLTNASTSVLSLTDLYPGEYEFKLTVTDDEDETDTDRVRVFVHTSDEPSERPAKKITILGSSSAYGYGYDENGELSNGNYTQSPNSWANLFSRYVDLFNSSNEVLNLALGGYTTYHIMPDSFVPPGGYPTPQTSNNITAAIESEPDAIIVNLPSNDSSNLYSVTNVKANFLAIYDEATEAGIPIWFTTSGPRSYGPDELNHALELRDWITEQFGDRSIDSWTTLANPDNTSNSTYAFGDGVHLNDAGYNVLYQRMVEEQIIEQLYPADITNIDDSVTSTSATITWDTSKLTAGEVEYGTSTDDLNLSVLETATSTTSHSVTLSGLSYDTTYYYRVIAEDEFGNTPTSTVASFTVGSRPAVEDDEPERSSSSGSRKVVRSQNDTVTQTVNSVLPVGSSVSGQFTRDLEFGITGADVRLLQQLLNSIGFQVAVTGPGSPGFETDFFGSLTQAAVVRYQQAKGIVPTAGYFGPITRRSLGL